MAYFIDGLGTLLFDLTIQVLKGSDCLQTIKGNCGDKITEILAELYKSNNLYGDEVKYTLVWNWKAENQEYDQLIEFIRGPIDTHKI
jgi:hypothetical protein